VSTPSTLSNELTFITTQHAAHVPKITLSNASGAGKTLSTLMITNNLVNTPLLPKTPSQQRGGFLFSIFCCHIFGERTLLFDLSGYFTVRRCRPSPHFSPTTIAPRPVMTHSNEQRLCV
jgi:hypothetical protein